MQEVEKKEDPQIPKPEVPGTVSGGLTPNCTDPYDPFPTDYPGNPNGPYDPLRDRPQFE
jgi:hypothetical protein